MLAVMALATVLILSVLAVMALATVLILSVLAVTALATVLIAKTAAMAVRLAQLGAVELIDREWTAAADADPAGAAVPPDLTFGAAGNRLQTFG